MYHNVPVFRAKTRSFAAVLLSASLLFGAAVPAQAALSQSPQTRQELTQTRLASMNGAEITRIDWRQPEMKLRFDLTESDWIDGIDLILAMTPQGNVGTRGPVLVSLNNSAPLKLNPYGKSFDARLRFDESFVRAKGNIITIRVPAPDGAPCLTSEHGHWDVNTAKSSIVVRTRAKSRNLYLREVAARLNNPTTAPKTVSIFASGADKARLQMLGAQGIALQTKDIPSFKTTSGRTDMEVIIARRDQLAPRVTDRDILSETGSKISVHKGRPMRLVITGDTDFEVVEAAKAFASHSLPAVRRRESSTGELRFQRSFKSRHTVLEGKTRFSELDQGYYAIDWRGTPNTIDFNVADPSMQSGKVLLRLSSGPKVAPDSKVEVELNGRSLGFAALDRKRKSVSFDIPEGALQGTQNQLKITPTLNKAVSVSNFGQTCPALDDTPGFFIGDGSRIELTRSGASPITELSRLTADGSAFAAMNGENTHIVLSANSANDLGASLEVMAKLAKTSGTGWTDATVSRKAVDSGDKNILIIGPKAARTGLLGGAPRALTAAMSGRSSAGQMARNAGDYEKFASADAAKTMQMYAAKTRTKSRIGSGGVAAVYPEAGRLIGVISSTPGRSFASVSDDLLEDKQWNKLSGSVARWNSRNVLMAQTAIPAPGIKLPKTAPAQLPSFDIAWLEDGLAGLQSRAVDAVDMASLKYETFRNDVETRLAQTMPAQTKDKTPRRVKLAQTPSAPRYTPAVAAPKPVTTALDIPAATSKVKTVSNGLVAELRGFSTLPSSSAPQNHLQKWMSAASTKFQQGKAELTLPSAVTAATQSQKALLSILMAIALLITVLMAGLVTPAPKRIRQYQREYK